MASTAASAACDAVVPEAIMIRNAVYGEDRDEEGSHGLLRYGLWLLFVCSFCLKVGDTMRHVDDARKDCKG